MRFVQLYHADWDHHLELNKLLPIDCGMTDQPAAALITVSVSPNSTEIRKP